MKKDGFTMVELLATIVIMSVLLVVSIPLISNAGKNNKLKTLDSKVSNIEKAAILYAQQDSNRGKFNTNCNSAGEICEDINGCKCFDTGINVYTLASAGFIEYDDEAGTKVINPTNKDKSLNNCTITVYKKYGKIYASYDKRGANDECWDATS